MGYVIGLACSARLHAAVELTEASLADAYGASGTKQRLIGEFSYTAESWSHGRCVITRLEYGSQGTNPRFIATNLPGDAVQLYDHLYCQRGEAENRIKEAQLDLFGTRASCSRYIANPLKLLLAALAYTLMQRLRALALQATKLERATPSVCDDSRSARQSCATRAACASFSPATTRCAICSLRTPRDWPRSVPKPHAVLSPALCARRCS